MSWSTSEPSGVGLRIRTTTIGRHLEISVAGEVDLANVEALRRTLSGVELADVDAVALDLQGLTFCDSAGCHALLKLERTARLSGRRVTIHDPTPTVAKVLTILDPDIAHAFA